METVTGTISGNTTGNLIGVDPILDSTLRDNGGATQTLALLPVSPAIDAGNPTTFPPTDQRGVSRPQDGNGDGTARSDIGAVERQPSDPAPPTLQFSQPTYNVGEGNTSVNITVTRSGDTTGTSTVAYTTTDADTFTVNCANIAGNALRAATLPPVSTH